MLFIQTLKQGDPVLGFAADGVQGHFPWAASDAHRPDPCGSRGRGQGLLWQLQAE